MPSPKQMMIAFVLLTILALCPACGNDNDHSAKSYDSEHTGTAENPELKKYVGPNFSFLYDKNMKIEEKTKNGITVVLARGENKINCFIYAVPTKFKPTKTLDRMIDRYTESLKRNDYKQIDEAPTDVQRMIGGQQIKGRRVLYDGPLGMAEADFYAYQKESKTLYFLLIAFMKDSGQAEHYFEIITDSVQ